MKKFQKILSLKNISFKLFKNKEKFFIIILIKKSIDSAIFFYIRKYFTYNKITINRIDNQFSKLFSVAEVGKNRQNFSLINNFYLLSFSDLYSFLKGLDILTKMSKEFIPMFFVLNNQFISNQQLNSVLSHLAASYKHSKEYFYFNNVFIKFKLKFILLLHIPQYSLILNRYINTL